MEFDIRQHGELSLVHSFTEVLLPDWDYCESVRELETGSFKPVLFNYVRSKLKFFAVEAGRQDVHLG